MGDAHQVVIDHVGQEVGGQAIGLHQHLHVHAVPRDLDVAAEHVRNHADALGGHLHADDMGLARCDARGRLLAGKVHAVAVIARGFLALGLLGTQLVQALGGAEAGEGMVLVHQLLGVLLVDLAALALAVGTMRAAHIRALVPLDAQPAQGVEYLLLGLAGGAQLVRILDAQDELATVLTGEAEIEEGDVGGTDVRVTGGRRRDAGADSGHGGS